MDVVLTYCDELFLDKVYSTVFPAATSSTPTVLKAVAQWGDHASTVSTSLFPRDSILRQYISLSAVALISAFFLYFAISTVSYYLIFDRRLEHHPRFLQQQVRKEIALSVKAMPVMALVIAPWFVAEVRGHSLLFDGWLPEGSQGSYLGLGPVAYNVASVVVFMLFTDYCIYWIHRWLHIPFLYKMLHKPHHRWLGE
jgi:lathosterol oxidase